MKIGKRTPARTAKFRAECEQWIINEWEKRQAQQREAVSDPSGLILRHRQRGSVAIVNAIAKGSSYSVRTVRRTIAKHCRNR